MRPFPIPAVLAIALAGISALPAGATHSDIHPTFRSEAVYFHCGQTKLHQANWVAAGGSSSAWATWNTTAPSQSVREGAGCGAYDVGGDTYELTDPVFYGTFTGNLRDLTVRLHSPVLSRLRQTDGYVLNVYAEVDGVPLTSGFNGYDYDGRTVAVTPVVANSGVTELFEFSISNIGFAREVRDGAGNVVDVATGGAAPEDGAGTQVHELRLLVGAAASTSQSAWAWDTTEVASGIVFNPPQLAAAVLEADLPTFGSEPVVFVPGGTLDLRFTPDPARTTGSARPDSPEGCRTEPDTVVGLLAAPPSEPGPCASGLFGYATTQPGANLGVARRADFLSAPMAEGTVVGGPTLIVVYVADPVRPYATAVCGARFPYRLLTVAPHGGETLRSSGDAIVGTVDGRNAGTFELPPGAVPAGHRLRLRLEYSGACSSAGRMLYGGSAYGDAGITLTTGHFEPATG